MDDKMIHQCGSSWAYCDGECKSCRESNIITTSHTYDYCMANNTNGYVYVIDNADNLKEYKADTNRISDAVERTKQYIKE